VSDLATEHSPLFYNVYRKYILAFTTSKTFTTAIENIAKEKNLNHMDAVLYYCDKEGIEPDSVGSLISKGLKEKIEANARELNFLPKRAQLPI
tara:strand:- start:545 stop:823 length:279 start_codon:yes stop_codon:yes gene_type:complete